MTTKYIIIGWNYLYTYPLHDAAFSIKTRSKPITAGKQCTLIMRTCWLCYELEYFEHINIAITTRKQVSYITVDTILECYCLVNHCNGLMRSIYIF